ncbi:uncharacterized protein LOC121411610 isoform X1 [Lytechinus variegatus]|uniref:uncharacterized protein LOC121411610 isoform X1 n=1 Tax=Lytechinus variegatus TaxID=7654 RepID=UPI001BB22B61|nr:uncharacterized protein LOC121411610 isoform X1 [Lytechinus variegatus]
MPLCQVKGCGNRSGHLFNKSMFCIPDPIKQRDRCEKWLNFLGREKLLPIEAYESLHNRSRVVCEDHFAPESYEVDMRAKIMGYKPRKKLKPDAVPTIAAVVEPKKHRSKTKRKKKKSKVGKAENAVTEAPCEEPFIPPLFPSRLPSNDEQEEDGDEWNHNSRMESEEETDSTSQCTVVEGHDCDVGPYCKEAGISAADISSHFQDILPLPTIKNGLVLEVIDYLQRKNMYCPKNLIKDLKKLSDTPDLSNGNVGGYVKRLMERRDRIEINTENGKGNLQYLCEEESMMTRPKTVTKTIKKHESPRTTSLHKNLQLAKKQRDETWKCLDVLEKDNQRLKQQNNNLSKRVLQLTTENRELREIVSSLQEQCSELQQFKIKYVDLEEKCKKHPEIDME